MKITPGEWLALDKYSKQHKLFNAMVGSLSISTKLAARNNK